MTRTERQRVHRAIAGALSRVDALWNLDELDGLRVRNGERSLDVLRELIVNELAGELVLELHPESFETLLDAVRMAG